MSDEEKKAWEELVREAEEYGGLLVTGVGSGMSILAANAEVKRLRQDNERNLDIMREIRAELKESCAEVERLHGSLADSNYNVLKLQDRIKQLEDAVDWACKYIRDEGEEWAIKELRRMAGMEG